MIGKEHRMEEAFNKEYVTNIYGKIQAAIKKYGSFHKVLFHLHTPASFDYKMLEETGDGRQLKDFSKDELFDIFAQTGIFNREQINEYYNNGCFDKVTLPYYIIAAHLIKNDIELVVISDHNTISGFDQLEQAVEYLYNISAVCQEHKYPEIALGIEISCADKNHVVAIFDKKDDTSVRKLKQYLEDELINEKLGTYRTSYEVMQRVLEFGGISYIAHVNTSNMFTDEKFLSMAYKERLFKSETTNVLGLKEAKQSADIQRMIRKYTKKSISFVYDSDSHGVDTINRLFFWIKGTTCNFKMLQAAFTDPDISIRLNKPKSPNAYIQGIFVKSSEQAFLYESKSQETMCIPFSEELNCLIGGRGSGKSTIINIIDAVLRQHYKSIDIMNAIFEYDILAAAIYLDGELYLVSFQPPHDKNTIEGLYYLWQFENSNKVPYENWIRGLRIPIRKKNTTFKKEILRYMKMFKINRAQTIERPVESWKCMLGKVLSQSYSINELVQIADKRDAVENYVKKVLLLNPKFKGIPGFSWNTKGSIEENLCRLKKVQEKRKDYILSIIREFNNDEYQMDKLKITYKIRDLKENFIDFESILKLMPQFSNHFFRLKNKIYNITIEGFLVEFYSCCQQMEMLDFLCLILTGNYKELTKKLKLRRVCQPLTQKDIEDGVTSIDAKSEADIIKEIIYYIKNKYQNEITRKIKEDYLEHSDSYRIEFNVSNRENVEQHKSCFRDITKLSLGQKVVAILSFILGYSKYAQDFRPLIIDQPEDNLDSQYIYKNLVQELRTMKGTRQVIVATHNATIVTNAKADQVIVMDSDGEHGWLKKFGYSSSPVIKKEIINYLEGGAESFKHKESIYKEVLNS